MRKVLVVAVLLGLLALALPLMAEDKVEVFGGYQYLHLGDATASGQTIFNSQGFNGWDAAAQFNVTKYFGIEGNFGGAYATLGGSQGVKTHLYTYTGGPVLFVNVGPIKPFVHGLFGGLHSSFSGSGGSGNSVNLSDNGYTSMVGGGLDVKVSKAVAVRLAEFDWVYYHLGSLSSSGSQLFPAFGESNNFRLTTGIVFRF